MQQTLNRVSLFNRQIEFIRLDDVGTNINYRILIALFLSWFFFNKLPQITHSRPSNGLYRSNDSTGFHLTETAIFHRNARQPAISSRPTKIEPKTNEITHHLRSIKRQLQL